MKFFRFSLPLFLLFLTAACASQHEALIRSTDNDLKYKKALEYFESKKYSKAEDLFTDLEIAMRGTTRDDTVQFYHALNNYYLMDYVKAEELFRTFATIFPRSPFAARAVFMRIDCLYQGTYRYELDQQPSRIAISAINEYLYDYPNNDYTEVCNGMLEDLNERLDRKAYESAKLYYKIEDYKAATYALKEVLKEDPDNRYREDIMYYIVASSYKFADLSLMNLQKDRFLNVIDEYYNFIGEFPESSYRRSVDNMYRKAQNVTRRRGYEDEIPVAPQAESTESSQENKTDK